MQKAACLAGLALHENRGDEMKIDKNRTLKLIAPFTLWAVGQHLLGATLSLSLSFTLGTVLPFSSFSRAKFSPDQDLSSVIQAHDPIRRALKPPNWPCSLLKLIHFV